MYCVVVVTGMSQLVVFVDLGGCTISDEGIVRLENKGTCLKVPAQGFSCRAVLSISGSSCKLAEMNLGVSCRTMEAQSLYDSAALVNRSIRFASTSLAETNAILLSAAVHGG